MQPNWLEAFEEHPVHAVVDALHGKIGALEGGDVLDGDATALAGRGAAAPDLGPRVSWIEGALDLPPALAPTCSAKPRGN